MLAIPSLFLLVMLKVSAEVITLTPTTGPIVSDLSVHTFLDGNGYIRLNITWGDILYDAEYVSISFGSTEECNPISDVENYALKNHCIIRPSMDLQHPADHIIHGCVYNVSLEDKALPAKSQSVIYKVPECVEKRCKCGDFSNSPNKVTSLTPVTENMFLLAWNTTTDDNITVHYIYYQRKDIKDSTKTYIPERSFQYRNNAVEIPMHDLKEDVVYTINVAFIDEFNECTYGSTIDYCQPSDSRAYLIAIGVIAVIIIMLVSYKLSVWSPRVRTKLERYFFLSKSYEPYENQDIATPLSQLKLREEINAQYTPLEFALKAHKYDEYEFPRNKIIMIEVIGVGEFAKVFKGKAYDLGGKPGFSWVAVKQMKDGASDEEILDFQTEIDTLKKIGNHENIVRLLGCVTMEEPYLMIMELVIGGSLKNYLIRLRKKWAEKNIPRIFFPELPEAKINYTTCVFDTSDGSYIIPTTPRSADSSVFLKTGTDQNLQQIQTSTLRQPETPSSMNSSRIPSSAETELTNLDLETPTPLTAEINRLPEPVLDHTELQQFAFQIANGMRYVEKLSITHRDLAARNILITSNKLLKISDFGMSRSGSYVNRKPKKMPLRWMAIESIEEKSWDNKSDVWSFGVVLWEIGTLGAFPYEHTHDFFVLPELKKGKRLERPKICTDELYALMLRCWSEKPEDRPTFGDLAEELDVKKRRVYIDFERLSPKYVFPPTRNVNEVRNESKSENK
uniref:Platelet-derived growth factor receptor alpha n=1 Tax=Anoplophora glabripennis TaxID=217634 RepID=V5G1V4_ANOGL